MRTERRPLLLSDTTAKGIQPVFHALRRVPQPVDFRQHAIIQKIYDLDFFLIRPPVVSQQFFQCGDCYWCRMDYCYFFHLSSHLCARRTRNQAG